MRTLAISFTLLLFFFMFYLLTGSAWNILDVHEFSFWLIFGCFALAIAAGGIAVYSFVSFVINKELRNLMLLLLGINMIIWTFLWLVTHPASIEWAPGFSNRDRNRTLALTLVLIIVPTILMSSFKGKIRITRKKLIPIIGWSAIILPLIDLLLVLTPEPLFIMTSSEGGIEGLTIEGMILSMSYLISQIISVLWFARRWLKTRDSLDFTLLLSVSIWIVGTIFIIVLWNPLQIAELLWLATIISGFVFIGLEQFITSILNPHQFLESVIEQRNKELVASYEESEYYLNMWTHKMGNLLQSVVSFLDILEYAEQNSEKDQATRQYARTISHEATLVNHQVSQLARIKDNLHQQLKLVVLSEEILKAANDATRLLGDEVFSIEMSNETKLSIKADDLLDLVFLSMVIFKVKSSPIEKVRISISADTIDDMVRVICRSIGNPLPKEVQDMLQKYELKGDVAFDLDLFTMKLLLNRYNGTIQYTHDELARENIFILTFKS